jgi:hypothetical protein
MSAKSDPRLTRGLFTLTAAILIGLSTEAPPAHAVVPDEVINWNAIATGVALPGGQNAIQQSRIYAMVQLAVHDALNAIDRRYAPYAYSPSEDPTASAPAAIATAAHDVLASQVPAQAAVIDAALTTSLSLIAPGASKDNGVAIGRASAAAMLALRAADGSSVVTPYTPGTLPGQWQPTPNPVPPIPAPAADLLPAILPGWGSVTPFALHSGAQFRPVGPPSLTSDQYTQDFDEVKGIGEEFSTLRTAEQSTIARFWYEGSPNMWNRITRTIALAHSLDSWDNARLLALVNVAMADGFIAGFNAKYYFNFWRPVTAIRAADTDGNDNTVSDVNWNTYLNTPAIPDYPSTHSVLGGAAAEVLARYFGTDDITFTVTSGVPLAGITRSFTSLSQAAQENADSRVYAGIHFRSACRDGVQQGRKIGKFTFTHYLGVVK